MFKRRNVLTVAICFSACFVSACSVVERAGIYFLYKEAYLSERQIVRNVPYQEGNTPDQRLDLFIPDKAKWPILIFVHGGGWNTGDKELTVGGADVYGNIGRFFASRGVGVAVINYRLLPKVGWRDQVQDVARAVAWINSHIAEYGADAGRLFLSGHSAGAQLAIRVALDASYLENLGQSPDIVCGVISVSGAGLDLADEMTYELGEDLSYYEKRFGAGEPGDGWKNEASPIYFARSDAPPFLILYAGGESKGLQRQSQLLYDTLSGHGTKSHVVVVPGESHNRMVLTLSRSDKIAAPAILEFIQTTICR